MQVNTVSSDVKGAESAVVFRPAVPQDAALLLDYIRKLAEYEQRLDEVTATEELLLKHMFGAQPKAECFFAVVDGREVGFALYFHNFSTFLGKPGIYIEDIYVEPEYRGHGIGRKMFSEIARIAKMRDCGRINWWCLDWNEPAKTFYQSLQAEPQDAWTVYKLQNEAIDKLCPSA